ncbi:MAG: hypothetical protein EPN97_04045 [Alphaproteobacteria bacterium]|nr:MAG: hypothetical protein EPN97_04045 [Alphaproteobacteria bacterium]
MADKVTWKQKLRASFDLMLLFGRGIEPFEKDNTKKAALQSLWIPAVMFPLGLVSAWLWPPEHLKTVPIANVLLTEAVGTIVSIPATIGVLWLAAVALNRKDRFWIAFQAGLWIGIPISIVSAPFLVLALMGWYPREKMDAIFTMLLYYNFIVGACVLYRGLKIQWEFAIFFACVGIFVGQMIQNVECWVNGVPIL